jgi:hypothetical protein
VIDVTVLPRLREGSIVERVRLVRPNAVDEAGLVLLIIVEDGVCKAVLARVTAAERISRLTH